MRTRTGAIALVALLLPGFGAQAEPVEYEVDLAHTDIHFSIMRFRFNRVIGHFRNADAKLLYDTDDVANSSVSVTIDVASLESGDETRGEHLQGEYWFHSEKCPHITFASTSIEEAEDGMLEVKGDLTIHGEIHNVPLKVRINKAGTDPAKKREALGVTARTEISRSQFGIKTAPPLIADDVHIHIELLAHASPGDSVEQ